MSTPAYPRYKESGVDWLGEVPEHWEVKRLTWLFRRLKITNRADAELLSVYRDYGVIPKSSRDDNFNKPSEDLSTYQVVEVGDLVLNKMKTWQGSIAISRYEGIVSPAYFVARPKAKFDLQFIHYLLRSPVYVGQYLRHSQGVRPNQWDLPFESFANIEALLPPISEQSAIASYLDSETARLDTLIAKQQRMIELSQEKRRALISQAVTRGLDETAPLKDSGVEWLGKVPAHWIITRIKHELQSLDTRRIPLSAEERGRMTEQIYDYYGASGVIDKVDDYLFDDDLLLIGEDGANLLTRSLPLAFIASGKFWVNNHAHILKPITGNLKYFTYLLETLDYTTFVTGSAQPKLTQEALANMCIPVAPLSEQSAIVEYLDAETAKIDTLIEKARRAIELMKEHRSALIASVVTGQIDVRERENTPA